MIIEVDELVLTGGVERLKEEIDYGTMAFHRRIVQTRTAQMIT